MSRNVIDLSGVPFGEDRTGRYYSFHAQIDPDYAGIIFEVAVCRLGDHAHLDVRSGRQVPQPAAVRPSRQRGGAGRLRLRWDEWLVLRPVLDAAPFIHIAEVEEPTAGQLRTHVG